jgi:hypothetical protein
MVTSSSHAEDDGAAEAIRERGDGLEDGALGHAEAAGSWLLNSVARLT